MKKRSRRSNLVVSGLLDYLSESGQKTLLPDVASELKELVRESKKADIIIVTSCIPLAAEQINEIQKMLTGILKTELPIKNVVEKSMLGGFVVKVGDWFLDASMEKEIKNIKKALLS